MAGGIQPVESNPRSDYGGGSVGGGVGGKILSAIKNRKKNKGGSGSSGDSSTAADPPTLKRGGKVRKTGMALVHKGERMLTKGQQKRMKMRGKRRGGKSR